jgi:hypothetical protein
MAVIPLDDDLEFDDDLIDQQIISLAAASGHPSVEKQIRSLFGTVSCNNCGALWPLTPRNE